MGRVAQLHVEAHLRYPVGARLGGAGEDVDVVVGEGPSRPAAGARSRALTSIEAMNTPPGSRSHSTSIRRSAWPSASDTALAQSARWTDTPRPG